MSLVAGIAVHEESVTVIVNANEQCIDCFLLRSVGHLFNASIMKEVFENIKLFFSFSFIQSKHLCTISENTFIGVKLEIFIFCELV